MDKNLFATRRKSYIDIGEIFFWTATINNWQRLLLKDEYKNVVINSLTYLSDLGKIDVFGFVIMPNHIHLIWRINEPNGKETTPGSFLKYTAHEFKKILKTDKDNSLSSYAVAAHNKSFEFWKRDSLAIHLFSKEMAFQKLDYIHYNPCTEYWQLAKEPGDYLFSSAKYYENGIKRFAFLKELRNEF
jgi:REP element-mobilizing transposase RayT